MILNDPVMMSQMQIYPDGIWVREGDEAFGHVWDNYEPMVRFYVDAAVRGDAVLRHIG